MAGVYAYPQVKDIEELNADLRRRCVAELDRVSSRQTETIGVRFEEEKALSASLPRHSFDACTREDGKVDKYQCVRFDNVGYSVPRQCAFQTVTVKGYVDRIEILYQHATVATHVRSYTVGHQELNPLHFLTTLERRPAALDHSNVYRNWTLPCVFLLLRERLEERHGSRAGARQYIRVLQLLAAHPIPQVQSAIEQLRGPDGADAGRIIRRVEQSAERLKRSAGNPSETYPVSSLHEEGVSQDVLSVQVPMPGLNHFNQFLSPSTQGSDHNDREEKCQFKNEQSAVSSFEINEAKVECCEGIVAAAERREPDAGEVKPQAVTSAHDKGGVRTTGSGSSGIQSDIPGLPAASDGIGDQRSFEQRLELTHQTGVVSRAEGSGHIRLLGVAIGQ